MQTPHDAVFKKLFSLRYIAQDYLRAELPARMLEQLRTESLQLYSGSFVSPELRETFTDVLYTAELNTLPSKKRQSKADPDSYPQVVTISFLFEHKSDLPECIHRQLLSYMTSVWDRQVAEKKALTPVIPLVIYHGKAAWKSKPFKDCFPTMPEPFAPFIPEVNYYLTDLQKMSAQEINQRYHALSLQVLFSLFRLSHKEKELAANMDEILQQLWQVITESPEGEEGKSMFAYLLRIMAKNNIDRTGIQQKISRLPQTSQTMFKSLYDDILEEGFEKGFEKGIEKGRHEEKYVMVEQCIREGLSIALTTKLTGLSEKEVKEIADRMKK